MNANKIEIFNEELLRAEEDVAENQQMDPNSYGVGYDEGFLDGLRHSKMILIDEEDPNDK